MVVFFFSSVDSGGKIKSSLLRFTVHSFEMKRNMLKASMNLRKCENDISNNIYFMPDLTKRQREEAFRLREQRRYRMNTLNETNL